MEDLSLTDRHDAGICGAEWAGCLMCMAEIDKRIKASLSNLCRICNNVAEASGYCFRHELKIEELHNERLYNVATAFAAARERDYE